MLHQYSCCLFRLVFKKMSAIIWFLFSVWTIECSNEVVSNRDRCPRSCYCNHVKRAVLCTRRGLTMVPESLPKGTTQLKLNGNILLGRTISRTNMTSHKSLEQLFMSGCGIKRIGVDAFVDLVNLRWLDLSNNRLSVLKENTFRGLRLQHLFLNGNQDLQLQPTSFAGLVTTGLYLAQLFVDCSVSRRVDPTERKSGELVVQRPDSRKTRRTGLWRDSSRLCQRHASLFDNLLMINHNDDVMVPIMTSTYRSCASVERQMSTLFFTNEQQLFVKGQCGTDARHIKQQHVCAGIIDRHHCVSVLHHRVSNVHHRASFAHQRESAVHHQAAASLSVSNARQQFASRQ